MFESACVYNVAIKARQKSEAVNFFEEEGAPLERLSPQKKFTAERELSLDSKH